MDLMGTKSSKDSSMIKYHNEIFQNMKCSVHSTVPFAFYCFDDKTFLCGKCFKDHKKHKLEIKEDLMLKASLYSQSGSKTTVNLLDKYNQFIESLILIKQEIDQEIAAVSKNIDELKNNDCAPSPTPKGASIFDLSYQDYCKISGIANTGEQIDIFVDKIVEVAEKIKMKRFKNIHWISNEVSVIDNTPFHEGFGPDIMLGKAKGSYYLGEGTINHMVTFDLGKRYFLKEIKLSVHDFECSLKNFKISVQDENGNWVCVGEYTVEPFSKDVDYQFFQVGCEGKIFKFDLLDNWGPGGGNYILVKKIFFNVGELID